jgi:hypothetical protein
MAKAPTMPAEVYPILYLHSSAKSASNIGLLASVVNVFLEARSL